MIYNTHYRYLNILLDKHQEETGIDYLDVWAFNGLTAMIRPYKARLMHDPNRHNGFPYITRYLSETDLDPYYIKRADVHTLCDNEYEAWELFHKQLEQQSVQLAKRQQNLQAACAESIDRMVKHGAIPIHKAVHIVYDITPNTFPDEIELPDQINTDDAVSDYIYQMTGRHPQNFSITQDYIKKTGDIK